MKKKRMSWIIVAAFVFGTGISFNTAAVGGCTLCFRACKTTYDMCLASGQSATLCMSQYTTCRLECPC